MKGLSTILVIIAFICVYGCAGKHTNREYQRYKTELMRIRAKFKDYRSIADETGIDSLVTFFEDNGTEEDCFLANYYLGYYYFDNQNWPRAYEAFLHTYEYRPKIQTEQSKDVLRGLFSICILLCKKDNNMEKAQEWMSWAEHSDVYGDEYNYVYDYTKATMALYCHQEDSCLYHLNKSYEEIRSKKVWTETMSWCLSEQAKMLSAMGKTADFKKRFDLLRIHPHHSQDPTTDLGAGLFFAQLGMRDSSIFYYKRATQSQVTDVALDACIRLAIDARNHGEDDSVFMYFQKCVNAYDKQIEERQASYSRRLEAVYRNQELMNKLAEQKLHLLTILLCVAIVLLLTIAGWTLAILLKKKLKKSVEQFADLQNERQLLEEKLQYSLEKIQCLEIQDEESLLASNRVHYEELCLDLKKYAAQKKVAPHHLCDELMCLFAKLNIEAIPSLRRVYPEIKPMDILICILVKNNFGLTEIAHIMDYDRQEVRQFMLRISKGLAGRTVGRIKEFAEIVDDLL